MVPLDDFKYGGTNLTSFRLLNPERDEVRQVVQDWIYGEMRYGSRSLENVGGGAGLKVFEKDSSCIFWPL